MCRRSEFELVFARYGPGAPEKGSIQAQRPLLSLRIFWSGRSSSVQDACRAASKLAGIPEFANFLALSGVGEPPEPGAEIVLHVIGVIRRGMTQVTAGSAIIYLR